MKKTVDIPESYDELTTKEFKYLLRKFWKIMYDENVDAMDIQRDLVDYILGRRRFINPFKREDYYILVNQIAWRMDWLFQTIDNQIQLNYNSTVNLLPKIGKYVGPQSHGIDLRFGEFRTAADIMTQYREEEDIDVLDALVGVLYRLKNKQVKKADFNGNLREPFNKHNIEMYADRVKHLNEIYKYGVYVWFASFCSFLISGTFNIEGRDICFAPVFGTNETKNTDEKQTEDKLGMLSILFTLADTGTFGNVEQTDNAPLLDVMCKLLNDYNLAKNMQRK